MMTHQDQQVTCTGDVWCGCACTDCTVTFEHCHNQGRLPVAAADIERIARTAYGSGLDIALQFDGAGNMMALAIADIEKAQTQLPAEAGLWDHVDLVRAARHLRVAARLVDTVADRINAAAVTR